MEFQTKKQRKPNPRAKINPISALLFTQMYPILCRNYKTGLTEDDLFEPLDEHKSSNLGDNLEKAWSEEQVKHKKYALHLALFRVFGVSFVVLGICKLVQVLIPVIVMPKAIGILVSYFNKNSDIDDNQAYLYSALLILSLAVDALFCHSTMMGMMHLCMKLRVACCSLIYRKALRLSQSSLGQTTIGQIVNLLSNDVSKFDQHFIVCHYVVVTPVHAILGTYLLAKIIGGPAAFAGIGFLILFIPLQLYLGKRTSVLRLRTALRTDERVRLMNEIVCGIKVIKMYTWERPFAKLVSYARRIEINSIRAQLLMQAVVYSLEMFTTRTSVFISILVYISYGQNITAETAFAITAIYNILRPIITTLYSESIMSFAEVHISISRLQKFLCFEELPQKRLEAEDKARCQRNGKISILNEDEEFELDAKCENPSILLHGVKANWIVDSPDNTLSDVNLNIERNQLIAVIGPVGSGKSSLFNVILRELPTSSGYVNIQGRVSYACQEPWLFSASVRQNILFGDAYDETRYKAVVKACALRSDLAMFPFGDRTIVGEKGNSLSGGQRARINLARAVYKRADIYLLDDPLSAVDAKVGKQLFDDCIMRFLNNKIRILITHQLQYLKEADRILIFDDGKITQEGTYQELSTSGLDFAKLLAEFQVGEEEEERKRIRSRQNSEISLDRFDVEDIDPELQEEKAASGNIKLETYVSYFRSGGGYFVILLMALAFVAVQGTANLSDYYVAYWVNKEQDASNPEKNVTIDRDAIIYTYSGIILATIVISVSQGLLYFAFMMRASINLHDFIFSKISYAIMRFFDVNPTGRILNRFSKDMGIIDEYIPLIFNDFFRIALYLFGSLILSAVVNPWFIIPSIVLLVIFYGLRSIYMETSRSVKRIEGITRSPIFNHMAASLCGVSTIRAFSAEELLVKEFDNHQDLHSSAWFLFILSNRTFGFWVDEICLLFITFVILCLLFIQTDYYGGDVGLLLSQYIGLVGTLQWGMRQWSELENHMTSVERVLEYTKLDTEPERKKFENLPAKWPAFGKIVFSDLSMKYDPEEEFVLKHLNFTIRPSEKIGIVGRTGAGKTSIIAALFHLYELEGAIVIDGVDTAKLPLDLLRSSISIIPQEPVLFSGSIRKNLDPFEEYTDDVIWSALEQVKLKELIAESPAGLNGIVSEGGSNFSIGQRQLVCLARAIIRNNKILVMDEATANVDPHTDGLIQKTIRKNFAQCTVLTIAHRLHTIMDSDRVLVMDAGRVIEFDHPHNLLQQTDSIFYTMVKTTGNITSKNLHSIAEESITKLKNMGY
ncbi:hypothetical protein PPYR_09595 [Photinus pyralis]|uniref:Uncharacterized protein n=2 Tax=Photinus pyralis TaxID=7054 RepID=A0A5N4AML5_PHOPY|nr:probable multidrug resistance-associated protein lethal(2)03659 isoform X1 [Photinus pyralis]XP_031344901.1 probable multidrug resistance-associated protein lethal(2)03659 isoform X1 [Photinus pyralis]XP_031344902.1 probable multidrug resistance-associated protein lethal(2)03659 isoform X1 [Photinus pyralis]XP_031344903.1 probable multidrug resistance-associated protein lethal(2)03659 isoform X1 [Photinus pyralis]KAB0798602.1 hypothetical protein PPYR_09595 [Photinus pyralis]